MLNWNGKKLKRNEMDSKKKMQKINKKSTKLKTSLIVEAIYTKENTHTQYYKNSANTWTKKIQKNETQQQN